MAFFKLALPSRFEVVRRIGAGGMGVVYEAIDLERNERIALKTILHHDADTVARAKHEFRALQDIHHPNLVALRELVADADDVFFTMELVDGVDLFRWIRGETLRASASNAPTAASIPTAATAAPASRTQQVDEVAESPESSVRPVRDAPHSGVAAAFDLPRLREAFRQVALGLSALHAAGKVHRDVKPSNVRVTPEGRVVLLDFGLVFEISARQLTEHATVGTPAYMAPEQAYAQAVGPPADWYAVGVMLYECLAGRRPFEGAPDVVLASKRFHDALAPSAFVADVPRDLDELCMELLKVDPNARPSGAEVLKRLHARSSERPGRVGAPFIGRDEELGALKNAFDEVAAGATVTVALHGESGVGKSSVVRRFLDVALWGRDDALVLSGRCYERESVPYKALDEIIELLSRRLARMPRDEVLALLPADASALALLFPAMGRVPALDARMSLPDRDPLERRRAAFRALRQLLVALARRHRVIITIDDLQWTDADSLHLLQELLRPPDAPPILLVLTMRGDAVPVLASSLSGDVRPMCVGRLTAEHARDLAEALLGDAIGATGSDAAAIAAEANGHPLFIDELVRHAALEARVGPLRLDDALLRRAERLDAPARRLLDVTCMLGAPVSQDVLAHAAGIDMGELARAVSLLRAMHFVRTEGARVADAIEPFHDRVREAVVARLDADARRALHSRIATALEVAKTSDPEVLATHWAGAGEPAKAAGYTLVAADQAARALAFRRSARLFERALALLPEGDARRRGVREQLGDARANAGESALAAAAYEGAAESAAPGEALDLRRRAAEQLLKAGDPVRGLAVARTVLAAVDLPIPSTVLGAMITLLWLRFVLWMRGTRFTPRASKDVPPGELTRIDVCWSVSFTLLFDDPLAAGISHARHVLLALKVGEPVRTARALAMEASYASALSFDAWPRAEAILAVARTAADDSGDPYAKAIVSGLGGIAACAALRFQQAITELTEAIARFRENVPGSAFEATNSAFFLFAALAYSGRYGELRPMLEDALRDAHERGDRYAAVMLRLGVLNSTFLFAGDADRAWREIAEARRALPTDRFRAVHHQAILAECYADLYVGEAERGHARFHEALPAIRRTLLLHLATYRSELAAIRARLALSCALRATGPRRARLLREATDAIPVLASMPGPLGRVNDRVVRANAAMLRGQREAALAIVQTMADETHDDAWLSQQSARLLLARERGDAPAANAVEETIRERGGAVTPGLLRITFPAFEAP